MRGAALAELSRCFPGALQVHGMEVIGKEWDVAVGERNPWVWAAEQLVCVLRRLG